MAKFYKLTVPGGETVHSVVTAAELMQMADDLGYDCKRLSRKLAKDGRAVIEDDVSPITIEATEG